MKRYIKSSTASSYKLRLTPEQRYQNIIIRLRRTIAGMGDTFDTSVEDIDLDSTTDYTTGTEFLEVAQKAFNSVADALLSAPDGLTFTLKVYTWREGEFSPNSDWTFIEVYCNEVKSNHEGYSRGYFNAPCMSVNAYGESHHSTGFNHLQDEAVEFVKWCNKKFKKLQNMAYLTDIPDEVLEAAKELNYWVAKEKLGGNDIFNGREYVKSRTINNSRSNWSMDWLRPTGEKYIETLFDFAENNNYTPQDLIQLCKDATFSGLRKK